MIQHKDSPQDHPMEQFKFDDMFSQQEHKYGEKGKKPKRQLEQKFQKQIAALKRENQPKCKQLLADKNWGGKDCFFFQNQFEKTMLQIMPKNPAELVAKKKRVTNILNNAFQQFRKTQITERIPNLTVVFYGSSQNSFWLKTSSDLDCSLVQEDFDMSGGGTSSSSSQLMDKKMIDKILEGIYQQFRKNKNIKVNKISASNLTFLECSTPFKFDDQIQELEFDVNIKSELGIFNTELLKTYSSLNKKFHRVGCFLKYWNKKIIRQTHKHQDVDNTNSLSSYAILMMLLVFLQSKYNLLPPLQKIYSSQNIHYNSEEGRPEKLRKIIDQRNKKNKGPLENESFNANIYFVKDLEIARGHCLSEEDDIPIQKILAEFFYFYAFVFDSDMIVNTVIGKFQKKTKSITWPFAIIDPFDLNHNPGRLLKESSLPHKCTIQEMIDSFYRIMENRPIFEKKKLKEKDS